MEQPFKQVRDIFTRLTAVPPQPPQQQEAEKENYTLERRSQPEAIMTLFLRIQTERGPRTVISSSVTLEVASEIAQEMAAAGHFATFVDQLPQIPMAERLSRRKYKKEFSALRRWTG